MTTKMDAESLLIAVFHKLGENLRLTDDVRLAYLFNEASKESPEIFGAFKWHPLYHDSKVLRRALQNLDLGGAIFRENASITNFRVAPRVVGDYGKNVFESLPDEAKGKITDLALKIEELFRKEYATSVI